MAKLRMAHASTHGARKPPGPKVSSKSIISYTNLPSLTLDKLLFDNNFNEKKHFYILFLMRISKFSIKLHKSENPPAGFPNTVWSTI